MSLDSWLAPRNPKLNPAPKRIKLSYGPPSLPHSAAELPTKSSPMPLRVGSATIDTPQDVLVPSTLSEVSPPPRMRPLTGPFSPPPRFKNLHALTTSENLPPEHLIGRPSLFGWKPSAVRSRNEISSILCLRNSPVTVLGHEHGGVTLSKATNQECQQDSQQEWVLETRIASNWPVVDMVELEGTPQILCATRQGTGTIDVETGTAGTFRDSAEAAITCLATSGNVVAVGGLGGTIGMIDTREMNYLKYMSDAHSILGGPIANRARPEVSALTWAGPTMLASASPNNESVKFWDTRYMRRKQPLVTTWAQTGSDRCPGGIVSIRSRDEEATGSVWALTRHGKLLKLNSMQQCPEYRLASPGLQVSLPNQSLDLIPGGHLQSRHRNHSGPDYPLIACSSSHGTVLVTEPSDMASKMEVDATFASRLMLEPLKLTNFVRWHPYMHELVCVFESLYTVNWTRYGTSETKLNPIKISMTTVGK